MTNTSSLTLKCKTYKRVILLGRIQVTVRKTCVHIPCPYKFKFLCRYALQTYNCHDKSLVLTRIVSDLVPIKTVKFTGEFKVYGPHNDVTYTPKNCL